MPPRSSLTSSFSVTDANNEVICPLKNNDGSSCRKRCTGVSFTFLFLVFPSPSPSSPLPQAPFSYKPHLIETGVECDGEYYSPILLIRDRPDRKRFHVANHGPQEKRYRSMQEHIRRAHPNHYIPKLPATEESFLLMVTTPPDQRAHLSPPEPARPRRPHGHGKSCALLVDFLLNFPPQFC